MGRWLLRRRGEWVRLAYFAAGISLYTLALNLFLIGNRIAAGGFSGIATVLHELLPVPVGTMVLLMNIPVFLVSIFVKGWPFTLRTLAACFLYAALIDGTAFLPTLTANPWLAVVCGGVLYGVGMACLVKSDTSVGGTDMVTRLLVVRWKGTGVGRMSLFVDGSVVILAVIVYHNLLSGVYAILTIVVCSLIADGLLALDRRRHAAATAPNSESVIKEQFEPDGGSSHGGEDLLVVVRTKDPPVADLSSP